MSQKLDSVVNEGRGVGITEEERHLNSQKSIHFCHYVQRLSFFPKEVLKCIFESLLCR